MESFSADYGQARTKFVEAAKTQGGELERIAHPARGLNGADLSMDIAWFGDRSASKVFVAFSGVHGVEGFFGSGVQIEWIHRSENRRLPRDTAALLVHAVNPYGFAWLRRTNEDNVDLNRNWIDFDRPLPTNMRYEEIAEDLCPPNGSAEAQAAADARLATWRERNVEGIFMQAVTAGQWRHADGLFYGGATPSWSRKVLTDVLKSHLGDAAASRSSPSTRGLVRTAMPSRSSTDGVTIQALSERDHGSGRRRHLFMGAARSLRKSTAMD
jgi:hypothetical protein